MHAGWAAARGRGGQHERDRTWCAAAALGPARAVRPVATAYVNVMAAVRSTRKPEAQAAASAAASASVVQCAHACASSRRTCRREQPGRLPQRRGVGEGDAVLAHQLGAQPRQRQQLRRRRRGGGRAVRQCLHCSDARTLISLPVLLMLQAYATAWPCQSRALAGEQQPDATCQLQLQLCPEAQLRYSFASLAITFRGSNASPPLVASIGFVLPAPPCASLICGRC